MEVRGQGHLGFRSDAWYAPENLRSFGHRSRMSQMGYSSADYRNKPVIGILNTWSDLNPCHVHFRERVESVKIGVWQAGGFPVELPAISLSESFQKPTTMLYRNLLALETEELIRSHPIDGAVLMGGCDKTGPALLMGAATADVPAIFLPSGPMLRGNWRGTTLGSGTDAWKYWDDKRAGELGDCEWAEIEQGIARSAGHCMTMGTASTMTSAIEALGMSLGGSASIPAVDSRHSRMATTTGRRVVQLVFDGVRPSIIMSRGAFDNAIATVMALGGSTNAVIHLIAMAGRLGHSLTLERFDDFSRRVPVLANVRPSGAYLMEDFYYAGGLEGLLSRITDHLDLGCLTVDGCELGERIAGSGVHDDDVIRPTSDPVASEGGLAVLRGNLAPDGCVIKHTAAQPNLLQHTGPAVVFHGYEDLVDRIDDPNLPVTADSVLVLSGAGPHGGPGMPEWGMLPIPKKLLAQGIRDMVRISDCRMSGTSYGACVLHVAPEGAVGGPLALVEDGDEIVLDVPSRRLTLRVTDEVLAGRRARWSAPAPAYGRGYGQLFLQHVTQADKGCDFDFLERGPAIGEPAIH